MNQDAISEKGVVDYFFWCGKGVHLPQDNCFF